MAFQPRHLTTEEEKGEDTAFNRTSGETILYATFLQVAATGPLTLTEGITAPDC
jgi:hypothetical protein